ncbi:MAG: TetR family transcriptional regulator [Acidimicrobiales bacterium]|nr:TetR family transcriptional regulator [Acidimicrobiales bacterium]
MSMPERFTMADLVARTGVPAASVRHYLALGLLPEPQRVSSNRFVYDDRHVEALRLIRVLRERRHLGLSDIGALLPELLGVGQGHAFRPEMWEQAVEAYLREPSRPSPALALVQVAVEAFTRSGYAEVTVDEICARANLAKGSFYRYFASKEELFFAAAEAVGAEIIKALDEAGGDGVGLDEPKVTSVLTGALAPRLPLVLELLARVGQRRPGYARVGSQVIGNVADAATRRLGHRPTDPRAGRRVVEQALSAASLRALGGPDR